MKIYRENIVKYSAKALRLKKTLNKISLLRLLIFIVSGIILISLFSKKLFTPFFVVLGVSAVAFALALKYYDKIADLSKHTLFLKRINEDEILRAKCDLEEFDAGQEFVNPDHPYTSDLDIFGQHSVFQLINRTTTGSGRILLAEWLSEPAPDNEISERQEAVKELTPKPDWRQNFQASGMPFRNQKSGYKKLLAWVEAPNVLLKNRILYILTAIVLSILSLFSFSIFIVKMNSPAWYVYLILLIVVLYINHMILKKLKPVADNIVKTSQENIDILRGYQALIQQIEIENFTSKKLRHLRTILKNSGFSAVREIKRLCRLLEFSQQRGINEVKIPIKGNAFYSVLNNFLLIDIYLIIGTEKWKSKNKAFLQSWADVVSEFEVINSFAGFNYSNPSYTFPELSKKRNYVHFESMGHPLINPDKRVCNDFHSEGQGDIVMITGSNMSGKSTFLRATGVNLVLALAGAPCCAKSGQVSNLKVYTSMRTRDNLQTGISSFYAELYRIEKMLKLIGNSGQVFFLLDEMFKGTNSEDRHKGGFSLINQISKLRTSGIIATHDIELAKLSEKKKLVSNFSFNSEIKGDSMIFSYKLHPGICNDFNASALMQKSGIKIIPDISQD